MTSYLFWWSLMMMYTICIKRKRKNSFVYSIVRYSWCFGFVVVFFDQEVSSQYLQSDL